MSSATLIDDGLLLRLVRDGLSPTSAPEPFCSTTGFWFRLARATVAPAGRGRFSQAVAELEPRDRTLVRSRVEQLDRLVRIADVRGLVVGMARLASTYGLNVLAAEVLAAALMFEARIVVTHGNVGPRLVAAAEAVGVELTELAP